MQNRTGILILTGIIALLSIYYLSFTFVGRSIKADATAYATNKAGVVNLSKKQHYLDSLWKEDVYLGNTFQEVTERELGLGLDLQGGMHVVLEVAPAEILRGMAGNTHDPKFSEAVKQATEAQKPVRRALSTSLLINTRIWHRTPGWLRCSLHRPTGVKSTTSRRTVM